MPWRPPSAGPRPIEDRPSLIILRSHIGCPSPNLTDTAKAHGDPFAADEIRLTKGILGLPADETFWVPDEVLDLYRRCIPRGQELRAEWEPALRRLEGRPGRAGRPASRAAACPAGSPSCPLRSGRRRWPPARPSRPASTPPGPTSPASCPGSADLTGNTGMAMEGAEAQSVGDPGGSRRSTSASASTAWAAIMNGMAAHGGVLPVGGTFFVFSDYMRGAVRLAALSETHVIYSWTHDSVGPGPGRPDPPAHRAAGRHAGHARPAGDPAGRRQRDGPGLAHRRRPRGADGPHPYPPVHPRPGRDGGRAAAGVARGAYVLRDAEGGRPRWS